MKSTQTIEEGQLGRRNCRLRISLRRESRHEDGRQRFFNVGTFELIFQQTTFSNNHGPRHGMEQDAIHFGHLISATQERTSRLIL